MTKQELIDQVYLRCKKASPNSNLSAAEIERILKQVMPLLSADLLSGLLSEPESKDMLKKKPGNKIAASIRKAFRRSVIGRNALSDQFKKSGPKKKRATPVITPYARKGCWDRG